MEPELLSEVVSAHLEAHQKASQELIAKTAKYPATYEEYSQLSLEERLDQAFSILAQEAPNCGFRSKSHEMPSEPFTFPINDLAAETDLEVSAQMAYSEGNWTNALNDTSISKFPHLKIHVLTKSPVLTKMSYFADLERHDRYTRDEHIVSREYGVLPSPGFGSSQEDVIYESNNPFFKEVIAIVDGGIKELYAKVINQRVAYLGELSVAN